MEIFHIQQLNLFRIKISNKTYQSKQTNILNEDKLHELKERRNLMERGIVRHNI